jgi:hypothetical protein
MPRYIGVRLWGGKIVSSINLVHLQEYLVIRTPLHHFQGSDRLQQSDVLGQECRIGRAQDK